MKYREIGEVFEYNGIKLKVKEANDCKDCYFDDNKDCKYGIGSKCVIRSRTDRKDIIYIRIDSEKPSKENTSIFNINILGENTEVEIKSRKDDKMLQEHGGYYDDSIRKITLDDFSEDDSYKDKKDMKGDYAKRVLRHEIIHALLYESGLDACSNDDWAINEEMVDFFAIQFPKLANIVMDAEEKYDELRNNMEEK